MDANTPSPTVVLLFITGHGLSALSGWLKHEWETAAKPFAIVTCVEALDTCVDVAGLHEVVAGLDGWTLCSIKRRTHTTGLCTATRRTPSTACS